MSAINQFLDSAHSSFTLIDESTQVYDLKLDCHGKDSLLRHIQFWKNWLDSNEIRKIVIQEYLNLNLIALTYACLEMRVTILTCAKNRQDVKNLSQNVDAVIIGVTCRSLFDDTDKKYFMIDQVIQNTELPDYLESVIDPDFLFLIGRTSGSTGRPKEIKHTARTFIAAAKCCTFFYYRGQRFAAYPNLNHIGMAANMVLSPTLSGCRIYSISNILELLMLCYRGAIDTLGLFTNQANTLKEILDLHRKHGMDIMAPDFKGVELMTGGSPLGPGLADWFFANRGKRIRSMFGNNEVLMPVFVNDVYNQFENFSLRKLGQPCPFVEYRIDENNNFWLKTPSISEYIDTAADGFYNTTDLIVEDNGEFLYKGRKKINGRFMTDLHDRLLNIMWQEQVQFDDYILHYDSASNKIMIISQKSSVLDAFLTKSSEIETILAEFNCDERFDVLQTDGSDGIKYVPKDPNLVILRNPRDY